jgi:hypothetical protein
LIFILVLSYNQPKLCSSASWYSNATTFATSSTVGLSPYGIFVNGINTVYVVSQSKNNIFIRPQGTPVQTKTISGGLNRSHSIFVSIIGDIYVDNGYFNNRVDKLAYNSSNSVMVMNINGSCYGLFIDINNNLHCSLADRHLVVKSSLDRNPNTLEIVAGNGFAGSSSYMLNSPRGIFVNTNFDLYVADCNNSRIQLFRSGESNAITKAGNEMSGMISLDCPIGVVLDADDYLFIVDSNNHRIIGSSLNGFRCIAGCSGLKGSSSTQLSYPQSMAFDSYGNIYVTDRDNHRIQKFNLKSCGKSFFRHSSFQITLTSFENLSKTSILFNSAKIIIFSLYR